MTTWTEARIAAAISRQTLQRRCVLLVDRCNWTGHECDILGVTTDLRLIDIEVKISRSDLKADARKDKWWHRPGWVWGHDRPAPVARPHPPKVWKHYFAVPRSIWRPDLIDCLPSPASGVILLHDAGKQVEVVRRATPAKDAYRLTPEQVMNIARLANLRMWDAYERAEAATRSRENRAEEVAA